MDIADLPPLFCRPRRSPRLNTDSRHASLCGFGGIPGAGSRRQSSVPRGNSQDVDSASTLGLGAVSGGSILGGVLGSTSGNLAGVVAGSLNNSSNNSPSGRPLRRVQISSGGDVSSKSTLNSQVCTKCCCCEKSMCLKFLFQFNFFSTFSSLWLSQGQKSLLSSNRDREDFFPQLPLPLQQLGTLVVVMMRMKLNC